MLTPVIDCHCHVLPRWLAGDEPHIRGVLRRCAQYGVEAAVVSLDCLEQDPARQLDALRRAFVGQPVRLVVTLGYEPPATRAALEDLPGTLETALFAARALAAEPEVRGIGEVGLDYYWPRQLMAEEAGLEPGDAALEPALGRCHRRQAEVFARWIELAAELGLPLVVHERQAHADARALLDAGPLAPREVMFHCFGASADEARQDAAAGYWISIPSSVVDNAQHQQVAAAAPLSQILVETDSPYHSPLVGLWKQAGRQKDQQRMAHFLEHLERQLPGLEFETGGGQREPAATHLKKSRARYRNEPTFVRLGALAVARAKGLDPDPALATLAANARRLFGL
jgi:TatD family hydrolase